jgi:hypothetical protein
MKIRPLRRKELRHATPNMGYDAKLGASSKQLAVAESVIAKLDEVSQVNVRGDFKPAVRGGKRMIHSGSATEVDHDVRSVPTQQTPKDGLGEPIAVPESVSGNDDTHPRILAGMWTKTQ